MDLTAETDRDAIDAYVADADTRRSLRRSAGRSDRLQRNARIRTGHWDLEVAIEADHPPAALYTGESGPIVVVSGDPVSQPVTGYPAQEWDLLVQKVWVMHEIGHLEHTDFDDLRARLGECSRGWRSVAGTVWNAFEDGAIDASIRDRWPTYGRWFAQVRGNLLEGAGPGVRDTSGGFVYPMVHAIVLGALDGLVVDSGHYERLRDPTDDEHHFYEEADRRLFEAEVAPSLAETIEAVGSMPDPVDRNRRVFEFVEAVRPAIEAARADGRAQVRAREGDFWGMPDDASLGEGISDPEPVAVLGGGEEGAGASEPAAEADPLDAAVLPPTFDRDGRQDEQVDEDAPTADPDVTVGLAEEIAEQRRRDSTERDARLENIEQLQAAVEAAAVDLEQEGVVLPMDDPEPDEATAAAARRDGERLARVLRNRFQTERRRSISRNRRRGRLDPSALHRHATGEKRLKLRRENPDDTDHHCLFVLDRSGSMRPHIRVAERAMGMLAFALEAVDVEVGVLELLDKEVRLAKLPDQEAGRALGRLFHGEATGGTPLTDTLHVAREQLKREQGNRFLFVVTDGLPADPDRYREALHRFPVPVVGVNLTTDEAAGESEFHRQVTVEPEIGELRGALRQLVQEVLFE